MNMIDVDKGRDCDFMPSPSRRSASPAQMPLFGYFTSSQFPFVPLLVSCYFSLTALNDANLVEPPVIATWWLNY